MDTKHKNITILSSKLLAKLNEHRKSWFTVGQVYDLFPELSKKSVVQQLIMMTDAGILMRIVEGLYYIIPYEQDSQLFMPDWHLLAKPLAGGEHYVGYYSALQIHNLITQPSHKEQIVINGRIKPSVKTIKGVKFQFIYHNPKHFFGYKKTWIDSFNKVMCSDLEKTISVVTAHKAGTTTITATTSDGGKTADCMVTSILVTDVQDTETPLATIYPNPNNGQFTVVFAEDGANRISIANVSGTILISKIVTGTNCKIDISNYPQGIYFLSIVNGKRKTTVKILMSF